MNDLRTLITNLYILLAVLLIGVKLRGFLTWAWAWVSAILLAPIVTLVIWALIDEGVGALRKWLKMSKSE